MISYELWMQRETGHCYAVRLNDGQLTGAAGPLGAAATSRRRQIAPSDYEDVLATARLEAHRSQYSVVDSWADSASDIPELDLEAISCIQWELDRA